MFELLFNLRVFTSQVFWRKSELVKCIQNLFNFLFKSSLVNLEVLFRICKWML